MVIRAEFLEELIELEKEIDKVVNCNSLTEIQLENFLKEFEKRRFKILNEIKKYNEIVDSVEDRIHFIDNEYKAEVIGNVLKLYIPETMPKYKNTKTHTYKRILLNVAEVSKTFKGMFEDGAFIYIKVFDNQKNWDIDNKNIKPIPDGLLLSGVIVDDSIDKMFYCVKGEFSEVPHTEVYIYSNKEVMTLFEKNDI